ncbi:hypothetical protein QWY77_00780 [Thalassotalea ponticola]|uniref:hypothetical protein n=1 Tax=Thalassotalea ponticola TaxID=1523392 RepID=UPI0025B3610E|nr:hypothetical protein [Thalassotalea ponticola]MDN3651319.1 hypothetical protein [Thalassotalea ponticola]
MKQIALLLSTLILALNVTGCAKNYQSVSQVEDSGFLVLKGNYVGTEIIIGDQVIVIDEDTKFYKVDGERVAKFPLAVGSHNIEVRRDGNVILARKLFLTNEQSAEVLIP